MMDRRKLIKSTAAALLATGMMPKIAFANVPTNKRFVLMFLRGGLDGLHAMPPFADPNYKRLRPNIVVENPIKLGGYFGLHPSLRPLMPLYRQNQLLFIPASSTDYRQRSHFDGQNFLENGSGRPYGALDGWLNRAIVSLNGGDQRLGLAIGQQVPLILQGSGNIQTWSETRLPELSDDFLQRLSHIYKDDEIFAKAFADAQNREGPNLSMRPGMGPIRGQDLTRSAKVVADLLSRRDGPRIAVLESQGWDTHFDQDRRLNGLLAGVADAITTLRSDMRSVWTDTVVLVVSEFGRTAAQNGNKGTDHGTGGLAMLAGGAIKGGRITGYWPGLKRSALYEGRDLRAVNSYEGIFKSILIGHLGLIDTVIADQILPGNRTEPMPGLLV
ncbi:MAG: DUF1501 domain-containing protein [Hellea sp.]|nr:DUF1501 domain-containing protein [Hellea sp.]